MPVLREAKTGLLVCVLDQSCGSSEPHRICVTDTEDRNWTTVRMGAQLHIAAQLPD